MAFPGEPSPAVGRASSFSPSASQPHPRASQTPLLPALSSFCRTELRQLWGPEQSGNPQPSVPQSFGASRRGPWSIEPSTRPSWAQSSGGPHGPWPLKPSLPCGARHLPPPGPRLLQRTGQPALLRARPLESEFTGFRGSVLFVLSTGKDKAHVAIWVGSPQLLQERTCSRQPGAPRTPPVPQNCCFSGTNTS